MAQDDTKLYIAQRDLSGGINSRMHATHILDNQASVLYNIDLSTPGQRVQRRGLTLVQDLGDNAGVGLFGFNPDGGTNELLAIEGKNLKGYTGSGTFTSHDTGFTTGTKAQIIQVWKSGGDGSVAMIQNGSDNAHEMNQDHTVTDLTDDNDDPPKSLANLFFRGRWWVLKDNELYWSSAYPSDYAGSFDRTTNAYKIPCGEEQALVGLRDYGIVCFGNQETWIINPSVTPAATDKAEKLLDIGCAEGFTVCQVGDDVWFLARDGVRGLFRTIQDKLQLTSSFPLSYLLKDEYEDINWAYISKAHAIYFNNMYFLALPTGSATYCNKVWVLYPSLQINIGNGITVPAAMVITGWNVSKFAKVTFNGEERLYGIDSTDGKVYRCLYGYDDNGTAITFQEESKEYDFGKPMQYKVGGEIEVEAQSASGSDEITVSASVDGGSYSELGTMSLVNDDTPTLPVTLPFTLVDNAIIRKKFHLEPLGRFRTLKIKLVEPNANSEDIVVTGTYITTFQEEYEDE